MTTTESPDSQPTQNSESELAIRPYTPIPPLNSLQLKRQFALEQLKLFSSLDYGTLLYSVTQGLRREAERQLEVSLLEDFSSTM